MAGATWREPPERPASPRFKDEAAQMRRHPGKWMLLDTFLTEEGTNARSMGNSIRTGRYTALRPAGAFESRTVTEQNRHGTWVVNVYARYTGAGDAGR